MSIRVTCPNPECERPLKLRDKLAGKKIRCPECGSAVHVPGDAGADKLVGKELAHYEILSKIGSGGMGAVYRARNLSLNKIVALKVLPESLKEENPAFIKRFIREAQSTAQLDHPNVVTVHYVGSEGDYHFIEMEYVDGKPLRDLLRDPDNITIAQATRITMDAAKALASAHEKGIVHRDVTPDNILITTKGKVKVADFGLATVGDGAGERIKKGKVFGTPYYMSPEHCRGLETDARSDIYSLGATYYHMLTGEPPYYGERPETIVRMHVKAAVPSPQAIHDDIPDEVDDIVMKMMAKDPDDRYETCEDLIEDLEDEALPVASEESTRSMVAHESKDDDVEVVQHWRTANVLAGLAAVVLVAVLSALFIIFFDPFPKAIRPRPTPGPEATPATPEQSQTAKPSPKPQPEPPATETKQPPVQAPKAEQPPKPGPKPEPPPKAEPAPPKTKAPATAAVAKPAAPSVDLKAYGAAVTAIDRLADRRKYDDAIAKANELLEKMPAAAEHLAMKKDNLARLKKQWASFLATKLTGRPPIPMGKVAKKYGYAGNIIAIKDTGVTTKSKVTTHIKWSRLSKAERLTLMELTAPPKSADASLALVAFCVEGTEKLFDKAEFHLGAAKGLGVDTAALAAEIAFLRSLHTSAAKKPGPKATARKNPPPAKPTKKQTARKPKEEEPQAATIKDLRKTFKNARRYPFSSASRLNAMKVQLPPTPRFARGKRGKALIIEPRKSAEIPIHMPKNAGMVEFLVRLSGPKGSLMLAAASESPPAPSGKGRGGGKPQKSGLFMVHIAEGLRVSFQKTAGGKSVQLQSKDAFPWDKWTLVSLYWGADGFKLFLNEKLVSEAEGAGLGSDLRSLAFHNRIQGGGKGQKQGQQQTPDTRVILNEVILYAGKH